MKHNIRIIGAPDEDRKKKDQEPIRRNMTERFPNLVNVKD